HKQLTKYHTNIIEHAEVIAIGAAKTVEEQIKQNAEVAKNLEEAKKTFANFLKTMPTKEEEKSYREAIENMYTATTYQITALDKALKALVPNEAIIKEHAATIQASITKAEKEHQTLRGVKK
ncbi:MAG: hypothetical protein ACHQII_07530, partial [Bacteroidia bacterium]